MTRRWIIRVATFLALSLCIGFWADSYSETCGFQYVSSSRSSVEIDSCWGAIYLFFEGHEPFTPNGVHFYRSDYSHGPLFKPNWQRAGFDWSSGTSTRWGRRVSIGIPFWFPTFVCTALLLFVWRKTRQNITGFSVDVQANTAK
jgi:hypothetical protein